MEDEQLQPLTEAEIEAGLVICAAATAGPWWAESGVVHACSAQWTPNNYSAIHPLVEQGYGEGADAEFSAMARDLLPRALAQLQLQLQAAEIEWLKIENEATEADLTNTRFVNSNTEERLATAKLDGARKILKMASKSADGDDRHESTTWLDVAMWLHGLAQSSDERLITLLEDK